MEVKGPSNIQISAQLNAFSSIEYPKRQKPKISWYRNMSALRKCPTEKIDLTTTDVFSILRLKA